MRHRIGVDLRPLQIGHQFRGIGEHIKSLIRYFPTADGFDRCDFTFYAYEGLNDPTEEIKAALRHYPRFDLVDVGSPPSPPRAGLTSLTSRYRDDRVHSAEEALRNAEVDHLLLFDFQLGVPASVPFRTTLVMYDLIPFLFPDQYYQRRSSKIRRRADLWAVAEDRYGLWHYRRSLERATANAERILTISDHTRSDLITHIGLEPSKLRTVLLGVEPATEEIDPPGLVIEGIDSDGDAVELKPADSRYLFYIGGTDFRRQLVHLIDSYKLAKQRLGDLKLVLAGADFTSLDGVHHTQDPDFKKKIRASQNREDVVFLGYISEAERAALYRNALAFVYPTVYEGFGLPILESMSHRCPTITFANSSTPEVGGDAVFYSDGAEQTADHLIRLADDEALMAQVRSAGLAQANKFPWTLTAQLTLDALLPEGD